MPKPGKNRANKTAKKVEQPTQKRPRSIRTKPKFYLPKTKALPRNARFMRTIRTHIQTRDAEDPHNIIISPITSEKVIQQMENGNILAFIVNPRANKVQIRTAFKQLHKVDVRNVNTLIRPDGKKKAYIRLANNAVALQVATKINSHQAKILPPKD
eukprot:TRINITY_DN73323_c0_g1_i1.p1 TRINITY_DN73323_c0_g1~~TRINITY_DN73323_c0_g1_i1.p1  ORF type:complete len:156 (+),score=26.46 TRINITY_DN73323_c0_g1_i1:4-471(+)